MAQDTPTDLRAEEWLKILGIELLCQWDVLIFHDRHQSSLVSAEDIARFLGSATDEVVAALDSLEASGLIVGSRVSQGVRLYQEAALLDPACRDALEGLMSLADGHTVRLLLARRRGSSD